MDELTDYQRDMLRLDPEARHFTLGRNCPMCGSFRVGSMRHRDGTRVGRCRCGHRAIVDEPASDAPPVAQPDDVLDRLAQAIELTPLDDAPLEPDELAHLWSEGGARCPACGHLTVLHNGHCCEFCLIDGCPCEWGQLP
jgi:hypothetical protein